MLLVLRDYYKRIRNYIVEGTWLNDEGVEPWRVISVEPCNFRLTIN